MDLFIIESWKNTRNEYDAYIHWIEYSLLTNIQKMASLRHGCTHTADLDWRTNELTRVTLKKIVDKQNNQLFDFRQVNYLMYKMQIVLLVLTLYLFTQIANWGIPRNINTG